MLNEIRVPAISDNPADGAFVSCQVLTSQSEEVFFAIFGEIEVFSPYSYEMTFDFKKKTDFGREMTCTNMSVGSSFNGSLLQTEIKQLYISNILPDMDIDIILSTSLK